MCQCLQALVPTSLGKKSRRVGPECCKADLNTCPVDQDKDHDADDDEDEKKLDEDGDEKDEDEDEGEECRLPASAPLSCL